MDQTSQPEGSAEPTPVAEMSSTDSAPQAETRQAKPAELAVIEEALGRSFDSIDQAKDTLRNLNSLVGDQTVAKQRKALEKLATQANLTPSELLEVIETQNLEIPSGADENPTPAAPVRNLPDETTKRLVRLETETFLKDTPEARAIKDQIFAEALTTGKPVQELWETRYAPLIETGKKLGAKKLQQNIEGQPTRAASTASEDSDTKVDFSKMSSKDMEKYIGFAPPSPRL